MFFVFFNLKLLIIITFFTHKNTLIQRTIICTDIRDYLTLKSWWANGKVLKYNLIIVSMCMDNIELAIFNLKLLFFQW